VNVRYLHKADIKFGARNVRFWGKADMSFCGANVCFRPKAPNFMGRTIAHSAATRGMPPFGSRTDIGWPDANGPE